MADVKAKKTGKRSNPAHSSLAKAPMHMAPGPYQSSDSVGTVTSKSQIEQVTDPQNIQHLQAIHAQNMEKIQKLHNIIAIQDMFQHIQNKHEQLISSQQLQIATLQTDNANTKEAWQSAIDYGNEVSKLSTDISSVKKQIKHLNGQLDLLRQQQEDFQNNLSNELVRIKNILINLIHKENTNSKTDSNGISSESRKMDFNDSQEARRTDAPRTNFFNERQVVNRIEPLSPRDRTASSVQDRTASSVTFPIQDRAYSVRSHTEETRIRAEEERIKVEESRARRDTYSSGEHTPYEIAEELSKITRHNSDKIRQKKKDRSEKSTFQSTDKGIDIPLSRKNSKKDVKFMSAPSSLMTTFELSRDSHLNKFELNSNDFIQDYDNAPTIVDAFASETYDIKAYTNKLENPVDSPKDSKPEHKTKTSTKNTSNNRVLASSEPYFIPQHTNYFLLPK